MIVIAELEIAIDITVSAALALVLVPTVILAPFEDLGPRHHMQGVIEDYWVLRHSRYTEERGPNGYTYEECCTCLLWDRETRGEDERTPVPEGVER